MELIVVLALLPSIVLAWWIYRQDKLRKEPFSALALAFVAGILSAVFTLLVHEVLQAFYWDQLIDSTPFRRAFFSAALIEELSKMLMFFWFIWKRDSFDERFDGIVYMCYIGLGFAFLENILYLSEAQDVFSVFVGRAIFAVPGHFLDAVLMGYFLGKARFASDLVQSRAFVFFGLFVAVLAHGCYDYLLMKAEALFYENNGMAYLLNIGFYVFDFLLWRIGLKHLRHMQTLDSRDGFFRRERPEDNDWRRRPPVV